MIKVILTYLLELLIVLPLMLLCLKKGNKNFKCFVLFFFFFLMNQTLLLVPRQFDSLKIIDGTWNWTGKLYAIIGSLIFYLIFRKYFDENNFITTKQKKGSLASTLLISGVVAILSVLMGVFLFGDSKFNIETLGFQLTMPGFDEEFAFRGIMMGLLSTSLTDSFQIGRLNLGHPGIWITAILFGLVHAFQLDDHWEPGCDWIYFSYTFLYGWILGWMVIKSRSVLMPIISHNSTNFIGTLTTMIK